MRVADGHSKTMALRNLLTSHFSYIAFCTRSLAPVECFVFFLFESHSRPDNNHRFYALYFGTHLPHELASIKRYVKCYRHHRHNERNGQQIICANKQTTLKTILFFMSNGGWESRAPCHLIRNTICGRRCPLNTFSRRSVGRQNGEKIESLRRSNGTNIVGTRIIKIEFRIGSMARGNSIGG